MQLPTLEEAIAAIEHLSFEPTETLTHPEHGPYLQKWLVDRGSDGSATYVHRFLRSDADDEMHDHPWDNATLVVSEGYWEITPSGRRWLPPGTVVQRAATEFHRVEIEPGRPPLSIFMHGPKRNAWGFLDATGVKVPAAVFLEKSLSIRI